MAPYGVHIVKRTLWRGTQEEFENVYHYNTGPTPTEDGWNALVDALVSAEQPLYASDVAFVRARVHGPTDTTKEADQMRFAKDLTGAGTATGGIVIPPELAVVVRFYLGRSPRGYKQILKKFLHAVAIEGTSPTTGHAYGRQAMASTHMAKFVTYGNNVKAITIGPVTNTLCNEQGKNFPAIDVPTVMPYAVTRQFKRGRKERVTP